MTAVSKMRVVSAMHRSLRLAWGILVAGCAVAAQAQGFPTKPITLIVPYGAGGPTDVQVRALATAASKELGQQIVITNVPGVGGTLGPSKMARSAQPDGYTLSIIVGSMFRLPHLQKVDFDPIQDFSYVIALSGYNFGFVVSSDAPWKSMADLIADAKKRPGDISAGASGRGTIGHIMLERFSRDSGAKFNFVPFKGGSEINQAILGKHLDVWLDGGFGPGIEQGKLRGLAIAAETRSARWPSIPTLKELGYNLVIKSPFGIAGPKGMDKKVVQTLHDAFRKSMSDPAFVQALELNNQPVIYMNSADYTKFAAESFEQEGRFVKEFNIKLD